MGSPKSLIDGPHIDKHCFVYCGDDACTCSAGPNWPKPMGSPTPEEIAREKLGTLFDAYERISTATGEIVGEPMQSVISWGRLLLAQVSSLKAELEEARRALTDALFCLDGVADGGFAPNGQTVLGTMATIRAALSPTPTPTPTDDGG